MLIYYIIGVLVEFTALLIWFFSPLKTSLGQFFLSKQITTNEEFEIAIMMKSPFIGKLLSCYICSSFWLALFIGTLFKFLFCLPLEFIPLVWFTYPGLAYLYKSLIDKNK